MTAIDRYPPYVYRDKHGLVNSNNEWRLPSIQEKEVAMGFPIDYTSACLPKGQQKGEIYLDTRHTLVGNSWHVPVIAWLLQLLCAPLGLTSVNTLSGGESYYARGRCTLARVPPSTPPETIAGRRAYS